MHGPELDQYIALYQKIGTLPGFPDAAAIIAGGNVTKFSICTEIPPRAAITTLVEIAKNMRTKSSLFINGILGAFCTGGISLNRSAQVTF